MPTRNAEAFVAETLKSLAAQTYPHIEVVISDDASTDQTVAVCQRIVSSDRRFRILRQNDRRGWVGNANLLLGVAQGDYCFFAFHDDPLKPTFVARLVEALETNTDAVLAFTDVYSRDKVDRYRELEGVSNRVERARRVIHRRGPWWIPSHGLFRSTAARRVGGLRRHLGGEFKADWPWLLHLALLGEFVRVPEPLIRKSWRRDSLSAKWRREASLRQSAGVLLACAGEVYRAGPSLTEQVQIQGELALLGIAQLARSRRFPWLNGRNPSKPS